MSEKNKIFFFAVNNTQEGSVGPPDTTKYEVTLIEGTINDNNNYIDWGELKKLAISLDTEFKDVTLETSFLDGSVFSAAKKNLVFVVKRKQTNTGKSVTAFFELEKCEKKMN